MESLQLRIKDLELKLKNQQKIIDKFNEIFEIPEDGVLIINSNVGVRGTVYLRDMRSAWLPVDNSGSFKIKPMTKQEYEEERLDEIQYEKKRQERLKKQEQEKTIFSGWFR